MRTITILLIEDNPLDVRLIREMLKDISHFKFNLISVATLKEGCVQIQKNNFDIILLDLNLPDSTGQQTFQKVIDCNKEIPVVLITSIEDEELSLKLIMEGAQDYVTKQSLNPALLGKSILYSIERQALLRNIKIQNIQIDGQNEKYIQINKELAFQNVEKEKRATELIIAKEKAEESDRLKSAFLANMSHEVRTPLNSIIGFSELLADPDFEEGQKNEFIQHIIAGVNNLLTIINDIMDISKLESGEITIRKSKINALKYISSVYEQFSFHADAQKLELKLTLPDNDEETIIIADAERLIQISNNLIGNALKFTENGSIEIGYQPKGKMVEFFVKDTGIGIPAEYHDIIFEHFRQVEDEKTRKYGGNGLGLAITKNLVGLMGGKIWLESESGKGSAFYFTLPAYKNIV
ncbi:MAG: ATP-binding protein [Bacteroidota bacterium]|nr:ATP-binding protein [Bacteroidota bacterium]